MIYCRPLPPQEHLRACLSYSAETGILRWKVRPTDHFKNERSARAWNTRHAGKPAFTHGNYSGYLCGAVDGVLYRAHRIIWVLVHGEEPEEVDHLNGIRSDNRLCNLRSASRSQNMKNMAGMTAKTASGVCGVYFRAHAKMWAAVIRAEGRTKYLGYFRHLEDAISARRQAEQELGYSSAHGRESVPC